MLRKIQRQFLNTTSKSAPQRLLTHSGIYATGNILRKVVSIIMLPIYTRFLTPADYGVVGLMTFAISLIELVFGARLGLALPKFYFDTQDKDSRSTVISTAMILTTAISGPATIALIFFRFIVSNSIFGTYQYSAVVGFFSITLLTQALENYSLLYLRFQQRPVFYVLVNLIKLVIQLTLNIFLVVHLKMGVMGVAISAMTSSLLFAFILLCYTMNKVGFSFDKSLSKTLILFCWPLWLAGFAGLYIGSANRYYIRFFSSLDQVGLFELAVKLSSILTFFIWEPFNTYWQVERFNYYQQNNAQKIFQNAFYFISTLLVLAALGISLFSGPVIRIMADPKFSHAWVAVPFLAFSEVFSDLAIFINFSFLIKEKTGWISRNNYLTAAFITVFNFLLIPVSGFLGASLALMFAKGIQFVIVYRSAHRFYDMGISIKSLIKTTIFSLAICLASNYFLNIDNIIVELTIKLLIYFLASAIILLPIIKNREVIKVLHRLFPKIASKIKAF